MPTPTGRTCCLSNPPTTTGAHPDPAQSPPPRPRGTGLVCLSPWHCSFWKQLKAGVLPGYSPVTETNRSAMIRAVPSFQPTSSTLGGHHQTPSSFLVLCASRVSMNSDVSKGTLPQLRPMGPTECRTLPGLCREVAAPSSQAPPTPPTAQLSPGGWPETCGI